MNVNDRDDFKQLILGVASTFGRQCDTASLYGYWIGLRDLTFDEVQEAAAKCLRTCDRMPTVAQLRGESIVSTELQAALAWETLNRAVNAHGYYGSVDFEDKAINAVIHNAGGWKRVCTMTADEFDTWFRKRFESLYPMFASRPTLGLHEKPLIGEFGKAPVMIRRIDGPAITNTSLAITSESMQIDLSNGSQK